MTRYRTNALQKDNSSLSRHILLSRGVSRPFPSLGRDHYSFGIVRRCMNVQCHHHLVWISAFIGLILMIVVVVMVVVVVVRRSMLVRHRRHFLWRISRIMMVMIIVWSIFGGCFILLIIHCSIHHHGNAVPNRHDGGSRESSSRSGRAWIHDLC